MTEIDKKVLVDWVVDHGTTCQNSFAGLKKYVTDHDLGSSWSGGFLDACETVLKYPSDTSTTMDPIVPSAPSQSVTEGTADDGEDDVLDMVNHPSHYETGKFECIEVMTEVFGVDMVADFCLGNAFKYIYRCMNKHDSPIEDVKKAIWYLNKFIELEG